MEILEYLKIKDELSDSDLRLRISIEVEKIKKIQLIEAVLLFINSLRKAKEEYIDYKHIVVYFKDEFMGKEITCYIVRDYLVNPLNVVYPRDVMMTVLNLRDLFNDLNASAIGQLKGQLKAHYQFNKNGIEELFKDLLLEKTYMEYRNSELEHNLKENNVFPVVNKI